MGQEDVLVEVIINGKEMLQFYSTKENYKTLYEDRDALVDTVKTAFKEGILYSADITNVDDIHSVQFLSEVAEVAVDDTEVVAEVIGEGEKYETYEVIEEGQHIETLTSTVIPEELVVDVGLESDERLNLCPHCDYRTFNVGHFKIHLRQHTGESPFECNLCDYKSKQKSNLKRHMRQHLLGKDHFECMMCNFTCSQEKVFKRHMILHSRTRPLRPCPFCDYFSTSLAHLTVHIRQHTGETPYHCGLCSYKTVQKSNLTRHLKKHRRGRTSKADKLRCCSYCSYRTPNPAHLMAHIRAAHTGETPFACHICEYKSAQRSNLKRHLRKHSGERPFKCHLCNYSTAYPYVLKKHIENHPPQSEKLVCDQCEFSTYSSVELKRHKRTHTGKPIHCCHICGYISLSSDHLKTHLRKHTMEKPFRCRYCHYGSAQMSNLKRHYHIKHYGGHHTNNSTASDSSNEIIKKDRLNGEELKASADVCPTGLKAIKEEAADIEEKEGTFNDGTTTGTRKDTEQQENLVEVVSEEHVITTADEQYVVIENEGEIENSAHHSSGIEQRSNLSFIYKRQNEKLKEFKRLLQEGANVNQNLAHTNRLPNEENIKCNTTGGLVGQPENAAVYTEAPHYVSSEGQQGRTIVEGQVISNNLNQREVLNQLVAEGSSILIVEHTVSESGEYEFFECEAEQVDGSEPLPLHSCELCGFTTHTILDLKEHIKVHTGEVAPTTTKANTPYFISCDECDFRALRKIDIGRHKALFHGAQPPQRLPFVCAICNFKAANKTDFLEHSNLHRNFPLKCQICEKKMSSHEELETHARTHIGEEPFECYHCAYLAARKCHLKKHIFRRHSGQLARKKQLPFSCYTCGYETTKNADFLNHIGEHKSESSNAFKCQFDHCRFITLDAEVFLKHQRLHSGNNEKKDSAILKSSKSNSHKEKVSRASYAAKEIKRTPLKEWGNLPVDDQKKLLSTPVSSSITAEQKILFNDDTLSTPLKKKRKALSSLGPHESLIEANLKRKFNFDPKNLDLSTKAEYGFNVDFVGEVYKGHGSLKRFNHFGEIINKEDEVSMVMTHPENEAQLKVVYDELKNIISSWKSGQSNQPTQFSIFFRETEDLDKKDDDMLSDIDISISSDDGGSIVLNDEDLLDISDSDIDLSDVDTFSIVGKVSTRKEKRLSSGSDSYSRKVSEEDVYIDLEAANNVQLIQEKIKKRNEQRKELRRLKAKNITMENILRKQ